MSSVSAIIHQAEQAKLERSMDGARVRPLTRREISDGLKRQISAKIWWIEKFAAGGKYPPSEVERKKQELAELVQARDFVLRGTGDADAG